MEDYVGRIDAVRRRLSELGSCAVCFSGGLDSTVLMDIAYRTLGDDAVAVMADVPMMSDRQREAAMAVVRSIGCRTIVAKVPPEDLEGILENGHNRCYICKTAMYSAIRRAASGAGISDILNGEIVDDLSEDRPGMAAGPENGIISPFLEADIGRSDIVRYLEGMDLPMTLVKDTCMLMRYPEGMPVTEADLRLVEELEAAVRSEIGLRQLRVRKVRDGFSVQTSTAELSALEAGFGRVERIFASRGIAVSLNRAGYDK